MSKFSGIRFKSSQEKLNFLLEERINRLELELAEIKQSLELIHSALLEHIEETIAEPIPTKEKVDLLRQYKRKFNILRSQEAQYNTPPVNIVMQIEDTQARIAELEGELREDVY